MFQVNFQRGLLGFVVKRNGVLELLNQVFIDGLATL